MLVLAVTGDRDQQRARTIGHRSDAFGDLEPVDSGKAQVEKDRARTHRLNHFERRRAVVRDMDDVALHPKQHRQALGGIAVVVDDEHGPLLRRRVLLRLDRRRRGGDDGFRGSSRPACAR